MAVKTICSFGSLMRLAKQMGDAEKRGDSTAYQEAKKRHDEYRDLCLEADELTLSLPTGILGGNS